jgi:Exportin 1-like protein/Importin-beta N-terminal domain
LKFPFLPLPISSNPTLNPFQNCQNLNEVQHLLKEFHNPGSSNERKRQIEQQIELFKNRPDAWKICLEALDSVDNQVLWFFCCSTVELLVANRWHTLAAESKLQIRRSVWNLCLELPKLKTTNIEKNKLCQLVALIAKREFPNDDPDFMNRLVDVLQTNFTLGVTIYGAINTEIVSTKADVTTEKKRDFQRAVEMYFSLVMPVLQRNLSLIACRICGGAGPESTEERLFQHLFADPNRLTATTIEFLTCLQTIFSWANLDTVLTNEMLTVIFALSSWNEEWSDIRITALATITDLFYRQRAIALVTETAVGIIQLIHQPDLPNADDYYQDRLTELLRLFTEQQWKKWVNTPDFPVHVYLTLLLKFTFACNSSAIGARLEIWKPIVAAAKKNGTQE